VTAYARSAWPDLVVGLGIAAMNLDAAREVWRVACDEHQAAGSNPQVPNEPDRIPPP